MKKETIINNVVTAIITTFIIAAVTWIFSLAIGKGELIKALGGVARKDYNILSKKIGALEAVSFGCFNIKLCQGVCDLRGTNYKAVVPFNDEGIGTYNWAPEQHTPNVTPVPSAVVWSNHNIIGGSGLSKDQMTITTELKGNQIDLMATLKKEAKTKGFVILQISYLIIIPEKFTD